MKEHQKLLIQKNIFYLYFVFLLQIKSVMTFDALLHVIMFTVSALKVLSDGDGKIPTKK